MALILQKGKKGNLQSYTMILDSTFLPSYMNTILGDHRESTILIDINFIKCVKSNESDQNFVIGDINYLDQKGLIKGLRQLGVPYRYCVRITSKVMIL
jgi:hypothetical protein